MRVGDYEVLSELGRGAMGVVYKGRAPDGREVVIKVILDPRKHGSAARFDRERRLLAELGEDSGFVPLLDAGEGPNGTWIVMPFVAGGTLRAELERGPVAVDRALDVAIAIGHAMGKAHAAGI